MSTTVQTAHPDWCDTAECDYENGGMHRGKDLTIAPGGIGWDFDDPIAVCPTWTPDDGGPSMQSGVYLYTPADGVLSPSEARHLAAMLVEAAGDVDRAQEAGR